MVALTDEELNVLKGLWKTTAKTTSTTTNTTTTKTTWTKTQWQEIKESLSNDKDSMLSKSSVNKVWNSIKDMWKSLRWAAKTLRSDKVSNKDISKWINNYDRRKYYNNILSNSDLSEDEYNYVYKSMVDEGVVDDTKYKARKVKEEEEEANKEQFKKVKENHINQFSTQLDEKLWKYFNETIDTYTIDVLTKAKSEMLKQYQMMYESMMDTYEDTRDQKILDAWDKDSVQYQQDILNFVDGWANSLTKNGSRYNTAYLDVINQNQYKEMANDLNKIQYRWTNKMNAAAVRSNFKWALNDLTEWKIWSALVGVWVWALNIINLALDAIVWWWVEELKQNIAGMYDVTEELVSLNVYKETDSKLRKWWWTVANWWVELIDALPQFAEFLVPFTKWAKIEKSTKIIKWVNRLSTFAKWAWVEARWVSRLAYTAWQLAADTLAYDLAFQQFTSKPLTTEDALTNMMFNLPIDSFLWAISKWAKYFKPNIAKDVLVSDDISKEFVRRIARAWDKDRDLTMLAEKYYISKWLEKEWRDMLKISEIEKTNPDLAKKIRDVQNRSTSIWDRLTQYDGKAEDFAIQSATDMSKRRRKQMPIVEQVERTFQDYKLKSWMLNSMYEWWLMPAIITWNFIKNAIVNGSLPLENAIKYINSWISSPSLRNAVVSIVKWWEQSGIEFVRAIEAMVADGILKNAWPDYVRNAFNSIAYNILKDNPNVVKEWDRIWNFYKTRWWVFKRFNWWTDEELTLTDVLKELNTTKTDVIDMQWASLQYKLNELQAKNQLSENPKWYININDALTDSEWKVLWLFKPEDWLNQSEQQRNIIKDIYAKAWVQFRADDWKYWMYISWDNLNKLQTNINKLLAWGNYNNLSEWEFAAYKILYAKDYMNTAKWYDLFKNASEQGRWYTTWFEKLFDKKTVNWETIYSLKKWYDAELINNHLTSAIGWWQFKDVENEAANVIISNGIANSVNSIHNIKSLWEVDKLEANDRIIWNTINNIFSNYKDKNGKVVKEVAPITNQVYNLVKWMGYNETEWIRAWEMIAWWFTSLINDPYSIKVLSDVWSDDLYKAVAARLILRDAQGWEYFRQTLTNAMKPWANVETNKQWYENIIQQIELLNTQFKTEEQLKLFDENIKKSRELSASSRSKINSLNKEVEELSDKVKNLNKAIKNWKINWKPTITEWLELIQIQRDIRIKQEEISSLKQQVAYNDEAIKEWKKQIDNFKGTPWVTKVDQDLLMAKIFDSIDEDDIKQFNTRMDFIKRKARDGFKKKTDTWIERSAWVYWMGSINDIRNITESDILDISEYIAFRSYDDAGFYSFKQANNASVWIAQWLRDLREAALDGKVRDVKLAINLDKDKPFEFVTSKNSINLWKISSAKILSSLNDPETYMHYIINHEVTHARHSWWFAKGGAEWYIDTLIADVKDIYKWDEWQAMLGWYLLWAMKQEWTIDDILSLKELTTDQLIDKLYKEYYNAWQYLDNLDAEQLINWLAWKIKEFVADAKAWKEVTGRWHKLTFNWFGKKELEATLTDLLHKAKIIDRFSQLQKQQTRLTKSKFAWTLNAAYNKNDLVLWLSFPNKKVVYTKELKPTQKDVVSMIEDTTHHTSDSVSVWNMVNVMWTNTNSIWLRVANNVSNMVGDWKMIDKYKVLEWKNTLDAYNDYVSKGWLMDYNTFLLNRYVANTLAANGSYTRQSVDLINANLSPLIDDLLQWELQNAFSPEGTDLVIKQYVNHLVNEWLINATYTTAKWEEKLTADLVIDMLKRWTDKNWALRPNAKELWYKEVLWENWRIDIYNSFNQLIREDTWLWTTDYDMVNQAIYRMYSNSKRLTNPNAIDWQTRYASMLLANIVDNALDRLDWVKKQISVWTTWEWTRSLSRWPRPDMWYFMRQIPEETRAKVNTIDTLWIEDMVSNISNIKATSKDIPGIEVLWDKVNELKKLYKDYELEIAELSYATDADKIAKEYEKLNRKAFDIIRDSLKDNKYIKKTKLNKEEQYKVWNSWMASWYNWQSSIKEQNMIAAAKHQDSKQLIDTQNWLDEEDLIWTFDETQYDYNQNLTEDADYLSYQSFDEDMATPSAESRLTESPYWNNDSNLNYVMNNLLDDVKKQLWVQYDEDFLIEETADSIAWFIWNDYNTPILVDSHLKHDELWLWLWDNKELLDSIQSTNIYDTANYVNNVWLKESIGKTTKDWTIKEINLVSNKQTVLSNPDKRWHLYENITSSIPLAGKWEDMDVFQVLNDAVWVYNNWWSVQMEIVLDNWKKIYKTINENAFWNSDIAREVYRKLWLPEDLWLQWENRAYFELSKRMREIKEWDYPLELLPKDAPMWDNQSFKRAYININNKLNEVAGTAWDSWNKVSRGNSPSWDYVLERLKNFTYTNNGKEYVFDGYIQEYTELIRQENIPEIQLEKWIWAIERPVTYKEIQEAREWLKKINERYRKKMQEVKEWKADAKELEAILLEENNKVKEYKDIIKKRWEYDNRFNYRDYNSPIDEEIGNTVTAPIWVKSEDDGNQAWQYASERTQWAWVGSQSKMVVSNDNEFILRMVDKETGDIVYWKIYKYDPNKAFDNSTYEFIPFKDNVNPIEDAEKFDKLNVSADEQVRYGEEFELASDKSTWKLVYDNKTDKFIPQEEYNIIKEQRQITKDLSDLQLEKPISDKVITKQTQQKITNRLMNLTNYDYYRNSEAFQQIGWMRVDFLNRFGEEMSNTITEMNTIMDWLDEATMLEVLKKIRSNAWWKIKEWVWNAKGWFDDWIPEELKPYVNKITDMFNEAGWKPATVFANLDENKWFSNIINSIVQNHKLAAMQYFDVNTTEAVRKALWEDVGLFVKKWQVDNIVSDIMWDPLGTGFFYNLTSTLRWLYRRLKYTYNVLWWTLMFANSAILGNQRYKSMMSWFEEVMESKAFQELIDSWWVKSLNRWADITINGNTDLWWSLIDRMANKLLDMTWLEWRAREIVNTIESWWIHSAYDLMAQDWVKRLALAQALNKQWIDIYNIQEFVENINKWKVSKEVMNKILSETELVYSRFFTNSSSAALSRHRMSRMYMFNNLQWYVINRTDEMTSSIKSAYEWIMSHRAAKHTKTGISEVDNLTVWEKLRELAFDWNDFVEYLNTDNLELKSFLNNVLMSAKMSYYYWQAITWQPDTFENFKEYRVDTSDYLSSLDATWFAAILSAPFKWYSAYNEYKHMAWEETEIWEWVRAAMINTLSEVCSRIFKEWKLLTATMNTMVAYGKTHDLDFASTVLWTELDKLMSWLGRFQLSDVDDTYDMEDFSSDTDIIWKILLTNHETSVGWWLKTKLNKLEAADRAINNPELAMITAVWYLPVIWELFKSATGNGWFAFNEATYKTYRDMVENDPVMKWLYHWTIDVDNYSKKWLQQLYYELVDFNYPSEKLWDKWRHLVWSYDQNTWEDYTIKTEKEEAFVTNMLRELNISDAERESIMEQNRIWKNDWLIKIMAMADAYQPGSGKVIVSYLANLDAYDLLKQATWVDYPSWSDITDDVNEAIQAMVVQKWYPELFIADKTSWYRAIQVYLNDANPEVFNALYKDQKLQKYTNTLWYMDMLMHQMAYEWEVDAKYIKNIWWMIGKYVDDDQARITLVNYTLSSIDALDMPESQKLIAKEALLAGNMDFYSKIKKNDIASIIAADSIDEYEHFVWWVKKELNMQLKNRLWEGKWYSKYYTPRKNTPRSSTPNYNNWYSSSSYWQPELDRDFNKWADKLINPFQNVAPNTTYTSPRRPYRNETSNVWDILKYYRKVYEARVKALSDKLVGEWKKPKQGSSWSKTYDWQYKYWEWFRNRGYVNPAKLTFPRHKQPAYSTKVLANMPGASG